MIVIIDYGMGNLPNVKRALNKFTDEVKISSDIKEIKKSDKLILPGVGAFGDAMRNIDKLGLRNVIIEQAKQKPLLGICLGLHLLFEKSEEDPTEKGLGLVKGDVKKFPNKKGYKIPEMGWNNITKTKESKILEGVENGEYFYFVHSYYIDESEDVSAAKTEYMIDFTSVIEKENIMAMQFHPEKSHNAGLKILENFVNL
ncbi:MAG: imidazole glycerol phosphate synthase subunit HisH [Fusobacteriota bacterium]